MFHFLPKAPFGFNVILLNYMIWSEISQLSLCAIMSAVLDIIIMTSQ